MELSDELYALQPSQGSRGRVYGSASGSNVLHLNVETSHGRITRTLNTSDDAKAIERARPIVAKAVEDGRIRPNSLAALTYAPPSSGKLVCCKVHHGGNYSTKIALLDGSLGSMSLGTGNDELAKDRMRVVVAAWLSQGLIPPTGKAARVYGPCGLDAGFRSETSRLEAERWFASKYQAPLFMQWERGPEAGSHVSPKKGMGGQAKRRAVLRLGDRKAPPFMQWARGPGGNRVLQSHLYLLQRTRLCAVLNTSDTKVAGQRMRLLLWHAINERQLQWGFKHPAWELYGGRIAQSTKRLLTWLTALPWTEYEPHRKEAAERLGYHATTIDWLTKHDKARAQTRAAARNRRARLRKNTGAQFPKRTSWHFRPVGSMLALHPDGPIYMQLTIEGLPFRRRLKARDRHEAAAIVEPVRSARENVRRASEEWGGYELGTPASLAAEARVVTACGQFATALHAMGAPDRLIQLAMKPPAQVGTSSQLPVAASRKAMNRVAEKKCVDEMANLIKAGTRMTIPEVARWAKQNFGVPRRRAVEGKNSCLDQARQQAKNPKWPPRGRPLG
jgi:hypothetical protein